MSDTVITMPDGSKWSPSTSVDVIQCSECGDVVDTEEEAQAYEEGGNCPHCGNPWVTIDFLIHSSIIYIRSF